MVAFVVHPELHPEPFVLHLPVPELFVVASLFHLLRPIFEADEVQLFVLFRQAHYFHFAASNR